MTTTTPAFPLTFARTFVVAGLQTRSFLRRPRAPNPPALPLTFALTFARAFVVAGLQTRSFLLRPQAPNPPIHPHHLKSNRTSPTRHRPRPILSPAKFCTTSTNPIPRTTPPGSQRAGAPRSTDAPRASAIATGPPAHHAAATKTKSWRRPSIAPSRERKNECHTDLRHPRSRYGNTHRKDSHRGDSRCGQVTRSSFSNAATAAMGRCSDLPNGR